MKTETKKLENCRVELSVSLDAQDMRDVVSSVEKIFLRNATIPGFRRGKAPLALVRRDYADGIRKETVRTLVSDKLRDAVQAEKLDVLGVVEVSDVESGEEGGGFKAVVEVRPVFDLPEYKGLELGSEDVSVSDEKVRERFEQLRAFLDEHGKRHELLRGAFERGIIIRIADHAVERRLRGGA